MQTESVNNSVVVEPKGSIYKLRFDDQVIHPSYYRFELQALGLATEFDEVHATVNTDGGSLATGIEVVNEILSCKAPVKGILRSNCHSCGSIMFLACHTHEVGLASEMLLHSGSGGAGGTPTQSIQRAHSYKRQVRELFETVYRGFLEEQELDKMIDEDREYIFGADEIEERLQRMYSYRQDCTNQYHEDMENQFVQENDRAIEQVLSSLDIPEEHKEIFSQVREAVDKKFEEEMNPLSLVSSDDVTEDVVTNTEETSEVDDGFFIAEIKSEAGEAIGWIQDANGTVYISLSSWDETLKVETDYVELNKGKCIEFVNTVTGKNYSKQGVDNIEKAIDKIVKESFIL